ncbi:hypothetical protein ACFX13_038669 [Malus domestica]
MGSFRYRNGSSEPIEVDIKSTPLAIASSNAARISACTFRKLFRKLVQSNLLARYGLQQSKQCGSMSYRVSWRMELGAVIVVFTVVVPGSDDFAVMSKCSIS